MPSTAFVFPGQGSQRAGMGLDLVRNWPYLHDRYYERADEILGFALSELCRNGPASALREMPVTQPAVLLTSVAALDVLRTYSVEPDVVAGHSLGEFSALVCAGVLEWTDALRLVRIRGELMDDVSHRVPGKMAAVVGLSLSEVEELCDRAAAQSGEVVEVANHNDLTQVVVSGQSQGIERLLELVRSTRAERVVVLEIAGPAHCSLMQDIEQDFVVAMEQVEFRDPRIPFFSGTTAARVRTAEEARECLRQQLTGRVRWTELVQALGADGVDTFVEVGPGKALGGMCRRILPGVQTFRTNDADLLKLAVNAIV
ncbi:ACP S-malonyltransferase [Streptomyces sp. NPDC014870]|uniref:ACP S-malonyltransferase n=1 Tax=Streptomyces sp. NPDC014870 TaxID=3364925 RepID=UPI0037035832